MGSRFMTGFALRVLCAAALAFAPVPALSEGGAGKGRVTGMPLPRFVSVRAETANARRGPSLEHRVDWTFRKRGLPLEVTDEYGNWRRVRDFEGAGGWVHHTLLSGERTVLLRGEAPAPLRAGPSPRTAIRAFAEPGVIARLEACGPEWCEVSAGGYTGWTPRADLWGVRPEEVVE